MVSININGISTSVPDGSTVMQAAAAVGFEIASLCSHPDLQVKDNCKVCVVDVNGEMKSARPSVLCLDLDRIEAVAAFVAVRALPGHLILLARSRLTAFRTITCVTRPNKRRRIAPLLVQ